jgi:uncharacterized protein YaaQ
MKLIIAIVQDYDSDRVLRGLTSEGFRVTRVSSMGGFLRNSNATLLVGVEDDRARRCLDIIRTTCGTRTQAVDLAAVESWLEIDGGEIIRDSHGGAVVLTVPVERFVRLMPLPDPAPEQATPLA